MTRRNSEPGGINTTIRWLSGLIDPTHKRTNRPIDARHFLFSCHLRSERSGRRSERGRQLQRDSPPTLPEEAARHADGVIIGDGGLPLPRLLEDFKSWRLERLHRNYSHGEGLWPKTPSPGPSAGRLPVQGDAHTTRGRNHHNRRCTF